MTTKPNPVGWFEIYVADLARAKAFYEAVFEVTLEALPPIEGNHSGPSLEMLAFPMDVTTYGAPGALCKMEGMDPGKGGILIYFSCADCAVEAARITANGGTVVKEKFSIGQYGDIAIACDTEGNMIGLHNPPANSDCCA